MARASFKRITVLWQRELRNNPGAFLYTPLVIAAVLSLALSISAMLANELTTVGGAMFDAMVEEGKAGSMNISFDIEAAGRQDEAGYRVIEESGPVNEEDWNFSREWNFELSEEESSPEREARSTQPERYTVNPLLNILHNLFLVVLYFVSAWYLLGSLFHERRDQSILFWKSMPVSDWEEVLARLGMVLVLVPGIYIAVSMVTQFIGYQLFLLLVEESEIRRAIDGNVSFVYLYAGQLQGWVLTVLWILPFYAWLLLASAAARRSPFLLAIVPLLGLVIIERLFLGSDWFGGWVGAHLPHGEEDGRGGMGFYLTWPNWGSQAWGSILLGLVAAVAALWASVRIRRGTIDLR